MVSAANRFKSYREVLLMLSSWRLQFPASLDVKSLIVLITILCTPASASVIHFDQPYQISTSTNRYPANGFGLIPPSYPNAGFLSSEHERSLLLLNSSPGIAGWCAWKLDAQGELDSYGPLGVGLDESNPVSKTFLPITAVKSDSLYYIYGRVFTDRKYLVSFQVADAQLNVITPLVVTENVVPAGAWRAGSTGLWITQSYGTNYQVHYLEHQSQELLLVTDTLSSRYTGRSGSGAIIVDSSLYISYETDDSIIACDNVSSDGTINRIATVMGFQYTSRYAHNYIAHEINTDSILFCNLDPDDSGLLQAKYFLVDKNVANDTTSMHQVSFPLSPPHDNIRYTTSLVTDYLYIAPTHWITNAYQLKFNWRTASQVDSSTIATSPYRTRWKSIGMRIVNGRGQHLLIDSTDICLLEYSVDEPSIDNNMNSIYEHAAYYRSPTMMHDGNNVILYSQRSSENQVVLEGRNLNVSGEITVVDSFVVIPPNRKVYRPALYRDDSVNTLLWYEDVTAFDPAVPADTSFLIKVVQFEGSFPTTEELANEQDVDYAPRSYDFRPAFVTIEDYLYIGALRWLYTPYYNDGHRVRLSRLDKRTGLTDQTNFNLRSNGEIGLLGANDTLIVLRSWYDCAESSGPNLDYCLRWRGGYSKVYFHEFQNPWSEFLYYSDNVSTARANTRLWTDANGVIMVAGLTKEVYAAPINSAQFTKVADLSHIVSPYGSGAELYPVAVGEYNCVLAMTADRLTSGLILFNRDWELVDSATIPTFGFPVEFSEIIPISSSNELVFAYSTYLPQDFASAQVFVQKVRLDITTDVEEDVPPLPSEFTLEQNYPNPFNPSTTIAFSLPTKSTVTLEVFNILGQRVKILHSGNLSAGRHAVIWDGKNSSRSDVSSGIYIYKLTTGEFVQSRKMILLK